MNKSLGKEFKSKDGRIIECIIDGCTEKPWAEGLCDKHLQESNEEQRLKGYLWNPKESKC